MDPQNQQRVCLKYKLTWLLGRQLGEGLDCRPWGKKNWNGDRDGTGTGTGMETGTGTGQEQGCDTKIKYQSKFAHLAPS